MAHKFVDIQKMTEWKRFIANLMSRNLEFGVTEAFKYTELYYGNLAAEEGRFRIRTLYKYRKREKFGPIIGDTNEGIRSSSLHFRHADMSNMHTNERAFLENMGIKLAGSVNSSVNNASLVSPNVYTY